MVHIPTRNMLKYLSKQTNKKKEISIEAHVETVHEGKTVIRNPKKTPSFPKPPQPAPPVVNEDSSQGPYGLPTQVPYQAFLNKKLPLPLPQHRY